MNAHTHDQAEGERRKGAALALVEARRGVFVRRGRRALLRAMLAGDGRACADHVREVVELPADMDPRCLGAVPGRLAYDRIIAPAGFCRSTRPEGHARWIQVWELADRAAAERWLRDHPDLPDPDFDRAPEPRQTALFRFDAYQSTTPTGATAGAGH